MSYELKQRALIVGTHLDSTKQKGNQDDKEELEKYRNLAGSATIKLSGHFVNVP